MSSGSITFSSQFVCVADGGGKTLVEVHSVKRGGGGYAKGFYAFVIFPGGDGAASLPHWQADFKKFLFFVLQANRYINTDC